MSSCQKKVLDLVPFTAQSDESAFANPDAVQLSVYGVYDACQSGFYAGGAVRGFLLVLQVLNRAICEGKIC